ncbi:Deoxyuridine 5'-triphosphate nucleotidohydrolase (plasmid) [Euzebya pacifica]|uniref:Deoxyuridine 5'-triphosphate nucleotidohydrolase n=1 Tax=Euzebya pacifica TaxID=1608957 RepID=A0A346Y5S3_9ACTN|nr:dUTP diphosphatase [Euzebya pacifica]AXV09820.1 Deoxyuridine 5'-triphosphate nucleotidohydrolase [Euzebya pacifica]
MSPTLTVNKLDEGLPTPRYARPGDAGLDLHATGDHIIHPGGGRAVIGTGIAIALPDGHAGMVCPRSGMAARHGITVTNAPGIIDAGYRGEIEVILTNTDPDRPHHIRRGDRIAQLLIVPVATPTIVLADSLDTTERGTGGLGSTGT